MRIHILLSLFLTTTSLLFSQNDFTGNITDAETDEPVFGANVYLPQLERGTVTGFDGNFTLKNVPNGTYKVVISSVGYASFSQDIQFPVNDEYEIMLAPSAIEMEEVIVSTPFHQLQSENVMMVERESMATLNRKGAITLADGITQIAGVESITTGMGIGKPVIRGLSSNRVLVYTQGVRLENQQYGDEHGLGISSKGIESVEVIKGPASLLYGSDAIGGVLYLNPERYAGAGETNVKTEGNYFSNTLGYQGSAMAKTSSEKFSFLARGSYAAHSDYETGDGERVTNTRFNEGDLKAGLGYRDSKYKADLRYNYNRSEIGIPEEMGIQSTDKHPLLPYQEIDNHILSLDNKFFFENSSLDLKIGYQFNDRREFEEEHGHDDEDEHEHEEDEQHEEDEEDHGHEEEHPALQMHLETLNYNLKYNLPKTGKFESIIGVQGMYQTNTNLGEEILIPDASTTDFGAFATTHLHLDDWDFQGGIRFDTRILESEEFGHEGEEEFIQAIDQTYNSFNGALGAKYNFTRNITARLNFASGFRAPNLAELTSNGSHHGTNRYEVGNPDLENEKSFQTDFSLEARNEHFEAFVNVFHNSISDYIFLNPTGEFIDNNPVFNYVQSNASLYGGEIGAHIHPHPIHWLHLESSFEMVNGEQRNGDYLPLTPANSLRNTLRVEFDSGNTIKNKYAFLRLRNVFDQNRVSRFETRTGGYSLLGAGIGGIIDLNSSQLQVNINATNLLNKTYVAHLSRLKTDNIADMGRNISVSLNWML